MSAVDKIKQIQAILGVTADGFFGPKSKLALEDLIVSVVSHGTQEPVPFANRWPKEADAASFYGHSDGSSAWESANLVTFEAPYALFMDGQQVRRVRCHRKVENSLFKILASIQQLYGTPEAIRAVGMDQYDGCYNFRSVRGSLAHLSMHAYGAAIDFDAAHNPLGSTQGRMPKEVVKIFESEGWRWGGRYSNRKDFMHFEACQ